MVAAGCFSEDRISVLATSLGTMTGFLLVRSWSNPRQPHDYYDYISRRGHDREAKGEVVRQ
jgi:hypothetical protein